VVPVRRPRGPRKRSVSGISGGIRRTVPAHVSGNSGNRGVDQAGRAGPVLRERMMTGQAETGPAGTLDLATAGPEMPHRNQRA